MPPFDITMLRFAIRYVMPMPPISPHTPAVDLLFDAAVVRVQCNVNVNIMPMPRHIAVCHAAIVFI